MLKYLTSTALVIGAIATGVIVFDAASTKAAPKYTFAVVPKNLNNPFFDQAKLGCEKAVAEHDKLVRS